MDDTNEPVFPDPYRATGAPVHIGMTLRDYFAGQALVPCLSHYSAVAEKTGWDADWSTGVALDAYKVADAMLAARAKR